MRTTIALVTFLLAIVDGSILAINNAQSRHSTGTSKDPDRSAPTIISDPPARTWRLYVEDPYVRDAARRMVEQAAHRLSFPQCQQLLLEFADQRGQHLSVRLTELRVTPAEYLRLIIFEDGTNRSGCRPDGVLAFTTPGSRVVYLCGRDFTRAAQRAPQEVPAVVIHEMLHSLGLGENPPSSKEITRRVKQQCWR